MDLARRWPLSTTPEGLVAGPPVAVRQQRPALVGRQRLHRRVHVRREPPSHRRQARRGTESQPSRAEVSSCAECLCRVGRCDEEGHAAWIEFRRACRPADRDGAAGQSRAQASAAGGAQSTDWRDPDHGHSGRVAQADVPEWLATYRVANVTDDTASEFLQLPRI